MSMTIRPLSHPDESGEGLLVFGRAMVGLAGFDQLDPARILEPDRFLGAVTEDGHVVGGADSYTSWLAVPGGNRVPHAAVTHIGVLPNHTRRGLVRRLIAGQFEDFARRGEVVASLRASEATIYGRFGYAVASSAASIRVTRVRAQLRPGVADPDGIRIVDDRDEHLTRRIYADARWSGAIDRPDGWWALRGKQAEKNPAPRYLVAFAENGVDTGYASYHAVDPEHWFTSPQREIVVHDLVAHTDAAYLGLLRHLLGLDLVDVVTFESRPVDDPLPDLLVDRRAAAVGGLHDETWLRLIDVEAALAARTYGPGRPVVITVTDPLLAVNNATFEVGPEQVKQVTGEPELTVDVTGLAAAYLGGTPWAHLVLAGSATEHTDGAAAAADILFRSGRLPFSGTVF